MFALGCVLFECLTGHAPFRANNVLALLARVLLEEAPRVHQSRPDLPDDLDALVARMLHRDPVQRLPNGEAVLEALRALAPMDNARPSLTSTTPQALTTHEQRIFSAVMAPAPSAAAATIVSSAPAPIDVTPDLIAAAATLGARVERMVDGSLVAGFGGHGQATDLAEMAARCALALRSMATEVPIALATGKGACDRAGDRRGGDRARGGDGPGRVSDERRVACAREGG